MGHTLWRKAFLATSEIVSWLWLTKQNKWNQLINKKCSNTENHFETQKRILWEILNFTPSSAALAAAPEVDVLLKFQMNPRLEVSPLEQQL
jgi:hypothetical protein